MKFSLLYYASEDIYLRIKNQLVTAQTKQDGLEVLYFSLGRRVKSDRLVLSHNIFRATLGNTIFGETRFCFCFCFAATALLLFPGLASCSSSCQQIISVLTEISANRDWCCWVFIHLFWLYHNSKARRKQLWTGEGQPLHSSSALA